MTDRSKIIFINPPWVKDFCRSARWAARSRARVQRHPDWMLTAAAVLEEAGCIVSFIDGAAEGIGQSEVETRLRQFVPDMAVIHTTTPSIYNDLGYAELVKKIFPDCLTVAIGPHVTAEPEDTFRIAEKLHENSLDCIARGEYDYSLRDLAAGRPPQDVPGVSWHGISGEFYHNPAGTPLDVNALPFPAWHLVDPRWYHDFGKKNPFLTLISGRGCTGRCTFCRDMQLMEGYKIRFRDPELVVAEIESDLRQYPYLKEIMFETDTLVAAPAHVEKICKLIIDKGLNRKLSFSCNTRVDMRLELLPLMKRANFRMLMTGFEFGTQAALDAVQKGITLEQSRTFAETAHRLGFIIHGCFMIGAPGETEDSARSTIEFAKSLPCDTVQFSGICTYPGTILYNWAKSNNYLVPRDWREWVSPEHEQVTLLSYPQLPKERIDDLIDQGLKEFYLRPGQILKMLFNLRSFGDVRRKLLGLAKFIDYFQRHSDS